MTIFDQIVERLRAYPEVQYVREDSSLTVLPQSADGFRVSLEGSGSEWIVSFDGWHEHFNDETEALNCFAFGLSEECRVRVTSRLGRDHRWVVEALEDDAWTLLGETGLLMPLFFLPKKERLLQNHIIKA